MSKTDLQNQAKYYYKKTLAGPGKFALFLLLCIFTVFSVELIGLSNKESNLEIRTINNRVIPIIVNEEKAKNVPNVNKNTNSFDEKLRISTAKDNSRRVIMRENILLSGALGQEKFDNFIHDI